MAIYPGSDPYYSHGVVHNNGVKISNYGDKYDKDDIICMEYDYNSQTVTFSKIFGKDKKTKIKIKEENKTWYGGKKIVEVEKEILIKKGTRNTYEPIKITKTAKYNLCVYLCGSGSSVELISFEISNGAGNNNRIDDDHNNDEFQVQSFPTINSLIIALYSILRKKQTLCFKHEKT